MEQSFVFFNTNLTEDYRNRINWTFLNNCFAEDKYNTFSLIKYNSTTWLIWCPQNNDLPK